MGHVLANSKSLWPAWTELLGAMGSGARDTFVEPAVQGLLSAGTMGTGPSQPDLTAGQSGTAAQDGDPLTSAAHPAGPQPTCDPQHQPTRPHLGSSTFSAHTRQPHSPQRVGALADHTTTGPVNPEMGQLPTPFAQPGEIQPMSPGRASGVPHPIPPSQDNPTPSDSDLQMEGVPAASARGVVPPRKRLKYSGDDALVSCSGAPASADPGSTQTPASGSNPTPSSGTDTVMMGEPGTGGDDSYGGNRFQLLDRSAGLSGILVSTHPDVDAHWRALQGPQHNPQTAMWLAGLHQQRQPPVQLPHQPPGHLPRLSSLNLAIWASQGGSTYTTHPFTTRPLTAPSTSIPQPAPMPGDQGAAHSPQQPNPFSQGLQQIHPFSASLQHPAPASRGMQSASTAAAPPEAPRGQNPGQILSPSGGGRPAGHDTQVSEPLRLLGAQLGESTRAPHGSTHSRTLQSC